MTFISCLDKISSILSSAGEISTRAFISLIFQYNGQVSENISLAFSIRDRSPSPTS
nr:MAG TPA: hypothetical protein [Caudoviricetes sp.]